MHRRIIWYSLWILGVLFCNSETELGPSFDVITATKGVPKTQNQVIPPSNVSLAERQSEIFGEQRHANILLLPPILFESHLFIFKTLGKGLRKFGHHLTLFVSDRRHIEEDSSDFSVRRFPGIFSTTEADVFLQRKVSNILSGKPTFLELFDILAHYSKNCDAIFLQGRESLEQLKREKYDLVIVDPNEMCGFLIAEELGLPSVVFSTGLWVPHETYVPSPISYVPEFNSQLTDRMNFLQRLFNTLMYGVSTFGTSHLIFPMYNRLIRKHHIGNKSIDRLIRETKTWLLCTDVALEFSRPLMPHVEYVGGILGRPAKPLPQALKDWADDSIQAGGFVVVSFGAGVQRLEKRLEQIYAKVLSKLSYRVIWRYGSKLDQQLGSNIKLVEWLPQNDILAHPNVLAFVGHGGTNGVYECLYHGVPIVGMPLFGDHYDSMTRVHAKGIGLSLSWKTLTETILFDAINEVVRNPSFLRNVKKFSKIHHDQPMSPLDRAAYRIDYTIRYHGADHLRPAVFDLGFVQYAHIDVLLAILLVCLAIVWVCSWLNQKLMEKYFYSARKKKDFYALPNSLAECSLCENCHNAVTGRSKRQNRSKMMLCCDNAVIRSLTRLVERIYWRVGLLLLVVCNRLKLAAVHIGSRCNSFRSSSRCCMRMLAKVSGTILVILHRKPPNSKSKAATADAHEKQLVSTASE